MTEKRAQYNFLNRRGSDGFFLKEKGHYGIMEPFLSRKLQIRREVFGR